MNHYTLPHQHGQSKDELMAHMPDAENFQILASIFKMLGDTTRIRIFWILCHCEECVINISAMMDMSSPAVAHHLKLLKDSGLVETRSVPSLAQRSSRNACYRHCKMICCPCTDMSNEEVSICYATVRQ